MTVHVEPRIKSTDLRPGDLISTRSGSMKRIVHSRKVTPDDSPLPGWWLAHPDEPDQIRGGIADAFFDQRWELVERRREGRPEEIVFVPVRLLERLRLRHSGKAFVGADVPLIEALIDCLPPDPREEKIERVAQAIHEADLTEGLNGLEWSEMNAQAKKRYILRARAALQALGEDA